MRVANIRLPGIFDLAGLLKKKGFEDILFSYDSEEDDIIEKSRNDDSGMCCFDGFIVSWRYIMQREGVG